jgi:tetratricopeptide (TPR) repeat protein
MAVREKQTRTIRMLAVALVVLVVLANMPFTWPTDSVNYNAHLWNAIGAAADTRGDKIMAKNSYQRALEFDPRFADAHFNLGSVYTRNGDDMRAEACYEGAVAARPDHDKARINLALLLAKRGRVEDALRQLTFAEMVNPLNAGAFYNHAAVLMQAGKRAEALAPLNRAAVLEPRYAPQLHVLERELNAGQKEVTR